MAYTTGGTWSVGESPTAAKMNTYIRDNVAYLHDSQPTCQLYMSAGTAIASGTWTAIAFDSEGTDNDSMHTGGTPSRIALPTTGRYVLTATAAFQAATNSVGLGARILLTTDSGSSPAAQLLVPGCSQENNGPYTSWIWNTAVAAANPYAELYMWQNSGGTLGLVPGIIGVNFMAHRL